MNQQPRILMFVLLDFQINYELASMFRGPTWGGTPTQQVTANTSECWPKQNSKILSMNQAKYVVPSL